MHHVTVSSLCNILGHIFDHSKLGCRGLEIHISQHGERDHWYEIIEERTVAS